LARNVIVLFSEVAMSLLDKIDRLRGSLDYHLERQNLLSSNLAQMNTPGFRAKDLERSNFQSVMHATLASTSPLHLAGSAPPSGSGKIVIDSSLPAGGDGNGVSLDREVVKIASNQVRYDVISGLASGSLGSLSWAVSDGRG
jgi:flagellar basal-body rod protein FlgB